MARNGLPVPNQPQGCSRRNLLVVLGLVLGLVPILACFLSISTSLVEEPPVAPPSILAQQPPQGGYPRGATVPLKLKVSAPAGSRITWTPPVGATAPTFSVPPQPGGPPYVFKNLTAEQLQNGVDVSYGAPALVPCRLACGSSAESATSFTDFVDVTTPQGNKSASYMNHEANTTAQNQQQAVVAPVATESVQPVAAPAATVPMWKLDRWLDINDRPMTPALCQSYVTLGQSANSLLAWRVPISDTIRPNLAYAIPLMDTPALSPTLKLIGAGGVSFSLPLEFRAATSIWANEHLPAAPGELWISLGVEQAAQLTCPADFNLPAGWSFNLNMWLDLSQQPNACEGCVLPAFVCYKGTSPAAAALGSFMTQLAGGPQVAAYPDDMTCVGPDTTPLVTTDQWQLDAYTGGVNVAPTKAINVHYFLNNATASTQTFSLTHASTLTGATWQLYPGLPADPWNAPDTSNPLAGSIQVGANGMAHIWMLTTAPATASGQYSMTLTAANAALTPPSVLGTTLLWVGTPPAIAPVVPGVGLTKSVVSSSVQPGELITYTLHVSNTGAIPITSLVISATVPVSTTYVGCGGADSCTQNGAAVRWQHANVGTGQTLALTLTVRVAATVAAGTTISSPSDRVSVAEGVSATGPVVEVVVAGGDSTKSKLYLPMLER